MSKRVESNLTLTSFVYVGCERNGDEVHNIHHMARVRPRSLEIVPEWEELHLRLQHPRTDCGYFQLGKRNENRKYCVVLLRDDM